MAKEFALLASPFKLQQVSYNMAPRALSWFIELGRFAPLCDKSASTLVAT